MSCHTTCHRFLVALALAFAFCGSSAVDAAEVSFTGGFTSFFGPAAAPPSGSPYIATVHTEINGIPVLFSETHEIPGGEFGHMNFGLGTLGRDLRAAGSPVSTVDFSRTLFDTPVPNQIVFTPNAPLNLQIGQEFTVGTFKFTNGTWFGNGPGENLLPDTKFGFTVTTHSNDPALDGHTFTDFLWLHITAPATDVYSVEADADQLYFGSSIGRELGTINVLELKDAISGNPTAGNVGTMDLVVRIGSLIPVALANPTGAAFIGPPVSNVPEPGEVALLLSGLVVISFAIRLRKCKH